MIKYDSAVNPTAQQVTFDKSLWTFTLGILPGLVQDPQLSIEYLGDLLKYRITYTVWGIDSKHVVGETPKTVWQHFKQDYMPKWFKRLFPVRYTSIVATFTSALDERVHAPNTIGKPKLTILKGLNYVD